MKTIMRALLLYSLLLPLSASAFYNPQAGRWLSRDPIEEKGGIALHVFVLNAPIDRLDRLGQFVTLPPNPIPRILNWICPFKCNGVAYNPFSHCCCKGKVVAKEKIGAGIFYHTGTYSSAVYGTQVHMWLEWKGYGSDGSAESNAPNNPSKISSPAKFTVDDLPLSEYYLSPCEYDFPALHKCLLATANAASGKNGPTCYVYIDQLMTTCLEASKGCTAK